MDFGLTPHMGGGTVNCIAMANGPRNGLPMV